mmetsp:Transcript_39978/g.40774  ORF Transcript_39978/g.40774 Transcript_39978/m.40774 type:complete len:745 (-) Transcript_39978:871-3105(-)
MFRNSALRAFRDQSRTINSMNTNNLPIIRQFSSFDYKSRTILKPLGTIKLAEQRRNFFFFPYQKYMPQTKINQLRREAAAGDQKSMIEYVRMLSKVNPKEALATIEKGWTDGNIPITEPMLKEYFKVVGEMKAFDSINLTAIISLINSTPELQKDILSQIRNMPQYAGAGISAGTNPNDPLYISTAPPTIRSQLFRTLRFLIIVFLMLSFTSAMLDDKSGGGIAGRMGMGSATHQAEHSDKSFNDVVGIDEAKGELQEIVQYLKDPKKFTRLGGKLPKGVLLTGPPGTGKTLLARAIAGEAGVPFFFASGSEFEEMFVGVGARRVRDLFDTAKSKSPCIVFIDEIDAIGGSRHLKEQSSMKMTLNQLLVEMDGFEQNNGVIVIAATNFPETLDSALIRPGRFDKHVDVPLPDVAGRKAILELYAQKVPTSKDVDMEQMARGTPGFSGAELYNLINQAALKASVDGLKAVSMGALEYAKDKILMGAEKKSAVLSEETMRCTAYHEAGHALVAIRTDGADAVHKATIMPRGRALGMVMQLPEGDQTSMNRKQMLARLDVCMAGRVAEELVFGADYVTSGASSDFQQATRMARAMVMKWGLSEKIGHVYLEDKDNLSPSLQNEIDNEVKSILSSSYSRSFSLLTQHRKELELLALALIQYETLSGGEIMDVLKGGAINTKTRSQLPSRAFKNIPLKNEKERNKEKEKENKKGKDEGEKKNSEERGEREREKNVKGVKVYGPPSTTNK